MPVASQPVAGPSKPRKPAAGPSSSGKSHTTTGARPGQSSGSTGRTASASKPREKKDGSPPALTRKEQAAKAFAQQAKRSAAGDSLFSVAALVAAKMGGGTSLQGPAPGRSGLPEKSPKNLGKGRPGLDEGRKGSVGVLGRSTSERRAEFSGVGMSRTKSADHRRLNGGADGAQGKRGRSDSPSRAVATGSKPPPKPKPPPVPSTARPIKAPVSSTARPFESGSSRRRRSPSSDSTATSASESPRAKRPRSDKDRGRERDYGRRRPPSPDPHSISATIQALFRRPGAGAPPPRRYADSDDDGSDDMEAGYSDVELEERRTTKIARKEDEEALKEEERRRKEKERWRRERASGR